ncbi:MAG: precorrin-8X methylmutase [Methyloligellaceae bacterium]
MDYLKDGAAIYERSFATIREEAHLAGLPEDLEPVAVRLIHTCGMTDLGHFLAYDPSVVQRGRAALQGGAPILCDANMVASGITRSRLPADNEILCTLKHDDVPELAKKMKTTRSAAAIDLWEPDLEGAVVAIGNAPTALFHLLERLDEGWPKPAAILAFPVGFIGAAESKQELAMDSRGVPFLTLHGRRGGSAMAVAAVNAIADERE